MRRFWWTAALVLAAACGPTDNPKPPPPETSCTNGADDNGDGLADCADETCSTHASCQSGQEDGGSDDEPCARQAECFSGDWRFGHPLPRCEASQCEGTRGLDVRLLVDLTGLPVSPSPQSLNIRFVSRSAVDGSAVTCARLREEAASTDGANASQLERSGRFNLLAYDTVPLSNVQANSTVDYNPLKVATGADFLIWVEAWAGGRDSTTYLPTGRRLGVKCVESGEAVAELKVEQSGSRAIHLTGNFQ